MSEFIADNIRIRTAGVCSCDAHCRSRREMRERHATPEQFERRRIGAADIDPASMAALCSLVRTLAASATDEELGITILRMADDGYAEGRRDALEAAAKICDEEDEGEQSQWHVQCAKRIREIGR